MPDLVWHQVTPGVWERDADEIEQSYAVSAKWYEGSGRMYFAITGHLSVTISLSKESSRDKDVQEQFEAALRTAWLQTRYDYPTIASVVTLDKQSGKWKKTYHALQTSEARDDWLQKTFKTVSSNRTGVEWANSDPPAPKMPTLFVIKPPEQVDQVRRDLVLRSPHDIIDGIGTLLLLNNLMSHASKAYAAGTPLPKFPLDGSEAGNLSPAYRIAAAVPNVPTPAQQKRLDGLVPRNAPPKHDPGVELLGIPYKKGILVPGRHQRVALTLSTEETLRLTAACKAAGATVTHAFHAAIALTLRDLQERRLEERRVRYVGYILRNERGRCVPPYNSPKHAAALYHSVPQKSLTVDMTVPMQGEELSSEKSQEDSSREEFRRILDIMKEFYHSVQDDVDHYALAPYIWAAGIPNLPPIAEGRTLPVPPPAVLAPVTISSMGVVDKIITPNTGPFELHDPWVTGEELRSGLGLFLGAFRGQLCLSGAYNDAWHGKEKVLGYLSQCKEAVFRGFGI